MKAGFLGNWQSAWVRTLADPHKNGGNRFSEVVKWPGGKHGNQSLRDHFCLRLRKWIPGKEKWLAQLSKFNRGRTRTGARFLDSLFKFHRSAGGPALWPRNKMSTDSHLGYQYHSWLSLHHCSWGCQCLHILPISVALSLLKGDTNQNRRRDLGGIKAMM